MSLSIGQIERERGEYIEVVKTNIIVKESRFVEIKSVCKSVALQCYENVSASLISLYQRFQANKGINEWNSIENKAPESQEGSIYSKEVLAMDKYGDHYLAVYTNKYLTWHESTLAPLGRIENITHWTNLTRP